MSHTRRNFLKGALGASVFMPFGAAMPNLLTSPAMAAKKRDDRDTVLVLVQLSGGNDGLNTVVPYADDEYGRNRSTLRMPTKDLHKINSYIGFHPRMGSFMRLYKEGRLTIVRGVGSPYPDRSHENAMRVWHTADPDNLGRQRGWLGRAVDNEWTPTTTNAPAVFVGAISRPFALNARNVIIPSVRSGGDLVASQAGGAVELSRINTDKSLLSFVRQCRASGYANSRRIEAAAKRAGGTAEYPAFGLAGDLRTVAQLIRADIGIRIFLVELGGGGIGGFDNHANQLGNHCAMLHQLSESIAGFVDDLNGDKLLDRVLLMTFSEFGRILKENGRRGTNHGNAAPTFFAGGKLKGGLVGTHPSLTDLDNGALKHDIDFRRVYATVLDKWLGFESQLTLDKQYKPLNILNT